MGVVDVKHTQEHELTLEWDSSSSNDMIADSTLALITGIDKSPASVKCKISLCSKAMFIDRGRQ
jgi:cleavage and polyadenylation specificity factor subunit 3